MRYLFGNEEEEVKKYFLISAEIALESCCLRARGGIVIVKDDKIIGCGFNSPPLNRCLEKCTRYFLDGDFKSDKTCCVHAEDRAVRDALKKGNNLKGSRIYYIRIDEKGEKVFAGKPYCTICSKLVLDEGIKEFSLWHENGIAVYDSFEYNEISFGLI